ncbi:MULTISPECIES: helix-turn-helix transcriptional regulator [unclassified Roseibium]|uniref:helix-turn-helix transcriptional regulator n=1 Tax=unclassified Roseibium TaxID=2629323 RepID=UPI00273D4BF3|nr:MULTISPECIES: helix-turn-helix transcriptional regulator [unclassified Roseibium]
MTHEQFRIWRKGHFSSQAKAADALGVSQESVALYERGSRRGSDPRPVIIPRTVELACAAIAAGITGYTG